MVELFLLLMVYYYRKWIKNANEEGSENERLPADENDQKHFTTWRSNQTTVHSELQY